MNNYKLEMESVDNYFQKDKLRTLERETPFAERLKELRKKTGKTQKEISLMCGLSESTYGTYEQTKYLPDADTIVRLANYYNVSADYLLGISNDAETERNDVVYDVNFSSICKARISEIARHKILTEVFEQMVVNEEFFKLLHYIHTFLVFDGKIDKKASPKAKEMWENAKAIDLFQNESIDIEALPYCGVNVSDVYFYMIQKKMKELLDRMKKDNRKYYSKKITRIVSERENH